MKILQLISSCGYYGAEAMLVTLTKALRDEGADASIGLLRTSAPGSMDVAEAARNENLPVQFIPCNGRWDQGTVREIRRILQEGGFDVVHGHGYKADLYGYAASLKTAAKRVATCHDSGMAKGFQLSKMGLMGTYGFVDKLVLRRFDRVAAVSPQIAEAVIQSGVRADRVQVIDNGINLKRFTGATPSPDLMAFKNDAPLIGLVARVTEGKGHHLLLRVAKELTAGKPSPKFVFIGDGPLEAELQKLASELGVTANVRFAGRRGDMPSVYSALDMFVLPSSNEGMPISVLEAMASGTPVIATRVGAIPSVVTDRSTGLLINPDATELTGAINELLSSPTLRSTLAQNAAKFVRDHYSEATMATRYMQVYAEALRGSELDSRKIANASGVARSSAHE